MGRALLMTATTFGVLVLAGCSSGSSPTTSNSAGPVTTPTHHHHPATPTPTTSASGSASTAPTASSPAATAAPTCSPSQLTLSLGQAQGGAGSFFTPIVLTNSDSGVTCSLHGFPGVSYLNGSGQQVGPSAKESGAESATVVLPPGGSASAMLQQTDPGDYSKSDCKPGKTSQLRVYPPGLYRSFTASDVTTICAAPGVRSTIGSMQSGSNAGQ